MARVQGDASQLSCPRRQEVALPGWEILPSPLLPGRDCRAGPAHETKIRSFSQAELQPEEPSAKCPYPMTSSLLRNLCSKLLLADLT